MIYLLIYRTPKQDIIYHLNNTIPIIELGSLNSFNWKLISIQIYKNGRFNNVRHPFERVKRKKQFYIKTFIANRRKNKIARLRYLLEKEENKWKMK